MPLAVVDYNDCVQNVIKNLPTPITSDISSAFKLLYKHFGSAKTAIKSMEHNLSELLMNIHMFIEKIKKAATSAVFFSIL